MQHKLVSCIVFHFFLKNLVNPYHPENLRSIAFLPFVPSRAIPFPIYQKQKIITSGIFHIN